MAQLNDSYNELFEVPSQKEIEEEELTGDRKGDVDKDSRRDSTYAWISCVDLVSETTRLPWSAVYKMSVIEFLNMLAYTKDKRRKEKEALEKWKRQNN